MLACVLSAWGCHRSMPSALWRLAHGMPRCLGQRAPVPPTLVQSLVGEGVGTSSPKDNLYGAPDSPFACCRSPSSYDLRRWPLRVRWRPGGPLSACHCHPTEPTPRRSAHGPPRGQGGLPRERPKGRWFSHVRFLPRQCTVRGGGAVARQPPAVPAAVPAVPHTGSSLLSHAGYAYCLPACLMQMLQEDVTKLMAGETPFLRVGGCAQVRPSLPQQCQLCAAAGCKRQQPALPRRRCPPACLPACLVRRCKKM